LYSPALSATGQWLEVPLVKQVKGGCGSAAVAMVMQYWSSQQPQLDAAAADAAHINQILPPVSGKGIPGQALKRYLEEHGFSAFIISGELRDLQQHLDKGRPIVVCLGFRHAPLHYVVVVGKKDESVIVNDPARGKLIPIELTRFLPAWRRTGNWALLAVPWTRPQPGSPQIQ
jgi:predicted double-glycine peptidase